MEEYHYLHIKEIKMGLEESKSITKKKANDSKIRIKSLPQSSRMVNGVPDNIYYFLLDWKDKNLQEYQDIKGEKRLYDLTPNELHLLYRAVKK